MNARVSTPSLTATEAATQRPGNTGIPESWLVTAQEAAKLLGISLSHFYQMQKAGKLGPAFVRLGRAVRWRRDELLAWIAANCPPRHRWNIMRAA